MVKYLYGDEEVSNVRPAVQQKEGEAVQPNMEGEESDEQVIVTLKDGTEKTVNRSELRQK
jgi:VCBS repeat-containing protein